MDGLLRWLCVMALALQADNLRLVPVTHSGRELIAASYPLTSKLELNHTHV